MVCSFLSFGALFASALLFILGGGLMNTQLSLRMTQVGFSTPVIGITMACYFLGLMSGYFLCHRLIHRVGHIRSFAVFASVTTDRGSHRPFQFRYCHQYRRVLFAAACGNGYFRGIFICAIPGIRRSNP